VEVFVIPGELADTPQGLFVLVNGRWVRDPDLFRERLTVLERIGEDHWRNNLPLEEAFLPSAQIECRQDRQSERQAEATSPCETNPSLDPLNTCLSSHDKQEDGDGRMRLSPPLPIRLEQMTA